MKNVTFKSMKKTWSRTLKAEASADKCFPLFCPIREYDWIDGWECNMISSETGVADDLCVFETNLVPAEGKETWVCTYFEKNQRIEYLRMHKDRVARLRIVLIETGDQHSNWKWELSMVGLNEHGNLMINSYDKEKQFFTIYEYLEKELNYYLKHNELLKRSE